MEALKRFTSDIWNTAIWYFHLKWSIPTLSKATQHFISFYIIFFFFLHFHKHTKKTIHLNWSAYWWDTDSGCLQYVNDSLLLKNILTVASWSHRTPELYWALLLKEKKKPTKLDSNTSKQTARKGERFSRMENHTSTLQSTHNREDIAQYWIAPNTCPLTGWEILLCLLPNSVSCFILSKKKNKRILTITKEEFHNKVRIILQELRFHPKWQKENAWGAVYSMDFFF